MRYAATPAPEATRADLVLVSHLHHDHCHLPSLARFDPGVPIVVRAVPSTCCVTWPATGWSR